jgi:hypothetical protein
MTLEQTAERQFGLITTKQLRAVGLSPAAISHRAKVGLLERVAHTVYRIPGAPHSRERALLAAQFSTKSGVLSHRSAGYLWSLKNIRPVRPELIVPLGSTTPHTDLIAYRRKLAEDDVTRKGAFHLTTPRRTITDLASIITSEKLEVVVDDAVTRAITTLEALAARTNEPCRGVKGVGTLRAIVEDRIAHGTPASYLETIAVAAIRKAGLPRPLSQFSILAEDGSFVARPDLVYPEIRLAIELDGDAYHAGKAQRKADLARQNRMVLAGWTFLRFGDQDIRSGEMCRSLWSYSSDT